MNIFDREELSDEMEIKYLTVGTVQNSNRKIIERDKIDTPSTYIYISTHVMGLVQALQ